MESSRRGFFAQSLASLALLRRTSFAETGTTGRTMGEAKFVDVDGIRTRYFEAGSGEAMLLVHGGHFGLPGSGGQGWMPVFQHLAKHFHVYALDKLGMGLTDNPRTDAGYSMKGTVDHIYGFAQKLGMQQIHLVGHS